MTWLFYAFVSAAASALTAILAKLGVEGEPIGWRVAAGVAPHDGWRAADAWLSPIAGCAGFKLIS